MLARTLTAIVCLLVAGIASADEEADRKALFDLEQAWAGAIETRDAKGLEAILAAGFQGIEADGRLLDRKQYLEARLKDPLEILSWGLSDVVTNLYGTTATVTGRYQLAGKLKDKKVEQAYRYVDVYVKQEGKWKAVSSQLTSITAK